MKQQQPTGSEGSSLDYHLTEPNNPAFSVWCEKLRRFISLILFINIYSAYYDVVFISFITLTFTFISLQMKVFNATALTKPYFMCPIFTLMLFVSGFQHKSLVLPHSSSSKKETKSFVPFNCVSFGKLFSKFVSDSWWTSNYKIWKALSIKRKEAVNNSYAFNYVTNLKGASWYVDWTKLALYGIQWQYFLVMMLSWIILRISLFKY